MSTRNNLLEKITAMDFNEPVKETEIKQRNWFQENIYKKAISGNEIVEKDKNEQKFIKISEKGLKRIRDFYYEKRKEKGKKTKYVLFGEREEGLGVGKDYISQNKYQTQFENKLGFRAFPGTLNVKIIKESIPKVKEVKEKEGIDIKGFKKKNKDFGSVKCFPSLINGYISSVIFPEKTNHDEEIIEIISPYELRKKIKKNKFMIEVKNGL